MTKTGDNEKYWEIFKMGFCFIGGGAFATAIVMGGYKTLQRGFRKSPEPPTTPDNTTEI